MSKFVLMMLATKGISLLVPCPSFLTFHPPSRRSSGAAAAPGISLNQALLTYPPRALGERDLVPKGDVPLELRGLSGPQGANYRRGCRRSVPDVKLGRDTVARRYLVGPGNLKRSREQ